MSQPTPDETILGLLAVQPRHGYELLEYFRDSAHLGQVWTLSTSQLYAVLKRLEQQGLTVGREVSSPDAPPRTNYAVTEAGLRKLHEWLEDPHPSSSVRRVRVDFLSRLYIAHLLNLPTNLIIERQRNACRLRYQELIAVRDQTQTEIAELALELMLAQYGAILVWLDRCK